MSPEIGAGFWVKQTVKHVILEVGGCLKVESWEAI